MTRPTQLRIVRTPLASLQAGAIRSSSLSSCTPLVRLILYSTRRNASSSSSSPSSVPAHSDSSTLYKIEDRFFVNPPSTTRPPPLDLPTREPNSSKVSHLVATGKAYFKFYKTGMSHVVANYRLNSAVSRQARESRESAVFDAPGDSSPNKDGDAAGASPVTPPQDSRAAVLLRERLRHDLSRLPVFALVLLICGEFTPLIVLLIPRVVPLPCRIPRQADKLDSLSEARRATSFAELEKYHERRQLNEQRRQELERRTNRNWQRPPPQDGPPTIPIATAVMDRHIARSLGLVGAMWDGYISGAILPDVVPQRRVNMRLAFLAADDAVLRDDGAAQALVPEEVRLACKDRGMDVRGLEDGELRRMLQRWLDLLAGFDEATTRKRMRQLLVTRPHQWPRSF